MPRPPPCARLVLPMPATITSACLLASGRLAPCPCVTPVWKRRVPLKMMVPLRRPLPQPHDRIIICTHPALARSGQALDPRVKLRQRAQQTAAQPRGSEPMSKSGKGSGPSRRAATQIVHDGRDPKSQHGFVNPPVYRGSTVLFPTARGARGLRHAAATSTAVTARPRRRRWRRPCAPSKAGMRRSSPPPATRP